MDSNVEAKRTLETSGKLFLVIFKICINFYESKEFHNAKMGVR